MSAGPQNVITAVRFRPKHRTDDGRPLAYNLNTKTVGLTGGNTFDHIFEANVDQESVYQECVAPMMDRVLEGFNATVICLGRVLSGRSYTMHGTQDAPGLIPLAIEDLGALMEDSEDYFVDIRIAVYEIVGEQKISLIERAEIEDDDEFLLDEYEISDDGGSDVNDDDALAEYVRQAQIRYEAAADDDDDDDAERVAEEDETRDPEMNYSNLPLDFEEVDEQEHDGVVELRATSPQHLLDIYYEAISKRTVAQTRANQTSGRSHVVVKLSVSYSQLDDLDEQDFRQQTVGSLTFFELAGYEKNSLASVKVGTENLGPESCVPSLRAFNRAVLALTSQTTLDVLFRESQVTQDLQNAFLGDHQHFVSTIVTSPPTGTLQMVEIGGRFKAIKTYPTMNQKYRTLCPANSRLNTRCLAQFVARFEGTGVPITVKQVNDLEAEGEAAEKELDDHIRRVDKALEAYDEAVVSHEAFEQQARQYNEDQINCYQKEVDAYRRHEELLNNETMTSRLDMPFTLSSCLINKSLIAKIDHTIADSQASHDQYLTAAIESVTAAQAMCSDFRANASVIFTECISKQDAIVKSVASLKNVLKTVADDFEAFENSGKTFTASVQGKVDEVRQVSAEACSKALERLADINKQSAVVDDVASDRSAFMTGLVKLSSDTVDKFHNPVGRDLDKISADINQLAASCDETTERYKSKAQDLLQKAETAIDTKATQTAAVDAAFKSDVAKIKRQADLVMSGVDGSDDSENLPPGANHAETLKSIEIPGIQEAYVMAAAGDHNVSLNTTSEVSILESPISLKAHLKSVNPLPPQSH